MKKLTLKQKKKIVNEWITKNGAATFDLKTKDIILHDGGLFAIENKPKVKEWTRCKTGPAEKRVFNGKEQMVYPINFIPRKYKGTVTPNIVYNFVKKKALKEEVFEEELLHFFNKEKFDNMAAWIWFEELDETINYLKRMRKMLNKIGYDTGLSERWKKKLVKDLKHGNTRTNKRLKK